MQISGRIVGAVLAAGVVVSLAACAPATPTPAPTEPTHVPSAQPSASDAAATPAAPTPAATATAAVQPIPGGWSFVGKKACPDSDFECVTLSVPRDHYAAAGPTWDVTFAIKRATKERVGTYVVITGGPGSSGIASADNYTGYYPTSIPEHFDIVFIDQRGVGQSHPIFCPEATAVYYGTDVPSAEPARTEQSGAAAKTYVGDCLTEAKADPADLPFYSTRQAVEDLEAIREYLAVEKLHLYGESYGTQYGQTYAAAHPDRIATLYLDGPVDLTVDGASYLGEAARTFNDTFIATLNSCSADTVCTADLEGREPLAEYDKLVARADAGGLTLDFPMGDGTTQPRTLTAGDIESAVVSYLYSPGDRELLLRALTAAYDGDLVPLARLTYAAISVDADTLKVVPDPTYSDAMYYAVECQDYVYNADAGSEADKLAAFMAVGRSNGAATSRFGDVYYSDMPCLFWPNHPAMDPRPAPIVNAPYPTVVMVATTDPITPVANAIRIANRLSNVNVIIQTGGPHVIFGWGLSCPDDNVAAYMVMGTSLGGPYLTCPGSVSDDYVATAADTEAEYKDAAAFMGSFTDQVENSNDYLDMLDADPIKMGCDFGGVLEYRPVDTGTDLTLTSCAFTPGMTVSGTGSIDDESGVTKLDITLPGGALRYTRDGDGKTTIKGTFRLAPVAGG